MSAKSFSSTSYKKVSRFIKTPTINDTVEILTFVSSSLDNSAVNKNIGNQIKFEDIENFFEDESLGINPTKNVVENANLFLKKFESEVEAWHVVRDGGINFKLKIQLNSKNFSIVILNEGKFSYRHGREIKKYFSSLAEVENQIYSLKLASES